MSSFLSSIKKHNMEEAELSANGLCVGVITYSERSSLSRAYLCLIRALLIFLAAFGTAGAAVSSFNLDYNLPLVLIFSIIICTYVAFLYYNRITFYVGYILYFILFLTATFSLYWYVNSGFQAFFNTVYEKYSDYFALSTLREAVEFITDRRLTVSLAMLFVVAFLAMLLNISISGYMNLLGTFLITFPVIQLGLYIDKKPSTVYLVMLLGAYITVAVLGRSSHYRIPDYKNSKQDFSSSLDKKKNIMQHSYMSDGRSILNVSLYSIVLCIVFLICTNTLFYSDLGNQTVKNKLKDTTDEYVKIYIQNGIWGFFDKYSAKGGLSSGLLGGVSSVRPDYLTDLTITYVPTDTNNIYLKAYEGANYASNYFSQRADAAYNSTHTFGTDVYCIADHVPSNLGTAKMVIENSDASRLFNYMPYYGTSIENQYSNDDILTYDGYFIPAEYSGFVSLSDELYPLTPAIAPTKEYEQDAYDYYLGTPDYLNECLDNFISEADLEEFKTDLAKDMPLKDKQKLIILTAETLRYEYINNFSYTMAPGATPRNKDFIEFFLTDQKRGYCAHFASSSAMILRRLGIPTRYIEGYMVSLTDIVNAEGITDDTTGWIDENTTPRFDTGVIKLDVTDGSAHAWTEIYVDGYGWIPYDFTPPSFDENNTNFSLGSFFQSLFMSRPDDSSEENSSSDNNNETTRSRYSFVASFGFIVYPLTCIVIFIIVLLLCFKVAKYLALQIRIMSSYNKHSYGSALQGIYTLFHRKCKRMLRLTDNDITASNLLEKLEALGVIELALFNTLDSAINKALYSHSTVTLNDYRSAVSGLKFAKKSLRKHLRSERKSHKASRKNNNK